LEIILNICNSSIRALIAGGGAPEIEVSQRLSEHAKTLKGMEAHCFEAFANALEVIPITLAENAGLNPINIVTELRNRHALGEKTAGINVKKVVLDFVLFIYIYIFFGVFNIHLYI
jgi:T-complex protein 1 subunit delta